MQAHPLSIPAARIPFQSPAPSPSAQPQPPRASLRSFLGLRRPAVLGDHSSKPSPSVPRYSNPTTSIAQTSGLAHDAGNLLGALGLYCDLLRAPGVLRPEHLHYATELGLISSRSSDLIQRLLALSLAQTSVHTPIQAPRDIPSTPAGSVQAQPSPLVQRLKPPPDAFRLQPTDVRRGGSKILDSPTLDHPSILRNLAPVLQRIAAGTARVSVVAPSSLPPHALPAEALERIAVNLVRNAVEAIRKQQGEASCAVNQTTGEIRVNLGIITGRLQLIVEDNGPGIPPPIAAAFMNPGELPPDSHRGLGHRIVHDLVTSSGGQISVRTRPGYGTLFCMKWPLLSQHPAVASSGASPLFSAIPAPTVIPGPASTLTIQKGLASC